MCHCPTLPTIQSYIPIAEVGNRIIFPGSLSYTIRELLHYGRCNWKLSVNSCDFFFCLITLYRSQAEAAEQKYDPGGWCERLQSSQLSAQSVCVRRSRIGGAESPLSSPMVSQPLLSRRIPEMVYQLFKWITKICKYCTPDK